MKRYLCWLALCLVIAAPAAAAACGRLWGRPFFAPRAYYGPPAYAAPPMMAGPVMAGPVVCPPPAHQYAVPPPAHGHVLPAPRIEPAPRHATPSPAPAPGAGAAIPSPMPPSAAPTRAPAVEPLVPTAGSDAPPKTAPDDGTKPAAAADPKREPMPDFPAIDIPKDLRTNPAPKPAAAKEPDMRDVPKVPAVGAPKETVVPAVPSPAPAPEVLIPPPSLPIVPDPGKREVLPSLTLPPEVPVAPEKKGDSTSRSSPLAAGAARALTVNVFPAKGEAPAGTGYRTVGFFNHTARDLALTIEGRAVKLPARSYLHAQLAATFTWSHGGRPSARETVPDGAGGVDVVFRD